MRGVAALYYRQHEWGDLEAVPCESTSKEPQRSPSRETSLVYAQQRGDRDGHDARLGKPKPEDLERGEARLAALKAGIWCSPERRRTGRPFEQAARDMAKQRMERISAMRKRGASDDSGRAPASARHIPDGHRGGIEESRPTPQSAVQEP